MATKNDGLSFIISELLDEAKQTFNPSLPISDVIMVQDNQRKLLIELTGSTTMKDETGKIQICLTGNVVERQVPTRNRQPKTEEAAPAPTSKSAKKQ